LEAAVPGTSARVLVEFHDPVATSIIAASAAELLELIQTHLYSDFYVPGSVLAGVEKMRS
jgi:hypothetical protein